jgi:hypothetical protein
MSRKNNLDQVGERLRAYGFRPPAHDEVAELLGLPSLPSLPSTGTPTIPSLPTTPTIPSLPTTPSIPSLPTLPSGTVPSGQDLAQAAQGLVPPIDTGQTDFNSLVQNSSFGSLVQQAWGPVQQQMLAEGLDPSNPLDAANLNTAQGMFANAYNQLTQQMGVEATSAMQAAAQYVQTGKTIAGAVQTVVSLIKQAEGVQDIQGACNFVGSLMGTVVTAAIASGAVTAGIGAAITAVVGVTIALIEAAWPGNPQPAGQLICAQTGPQGAQIYCSGASFTVGCICCFSHAPIGQTTPIGPGTSVWRDFPNPTDPNDAGWFQYVGVIGQPQSATGPFGGPTAGAGAPGYTYPLQGAPTAGNAPQGLGVWKNATWSTPFAGMRTIDGAFPNYRQLEYELTVPFGNEVEPCPPALVDFGKAFFAAWKSNQAFALNGLKPIPDEQVLLQTLAMFNRSHDGSTTYEITADYSNATVMPPPQLAATGVLDPTPASPFIPYVRMIAYSAIGDPSAKNFRDPKSGNLLVLNPSGDGGRGSLIVHTGAQKTPPNAALLPNLSTPAMKSGGTASSSSTATVATVAVAGAALAGIGWLAIGRPLSWAALKAALGGL